MEAYIHEASDAGDTFTVIFSGCDYRCLFCNTPHLLEPKAETARELREVQLLIAASGATRLLCTGGEPLLQRQALLEILRAAKRRGMRTVVDTNASKPEAVRTLVEERLVDHFIVDVKAPRSSFGRVTRAATFFKPEEELYAEFIASLRILKESGCSVEYRTIVTPGLLYRKEEILELAALLAEQPGTWFLIPFSPDGTEAQMRGIAPPTGRFLENLASFARKAHPTLDVQLLER